MLVKLLGLMAFYAPPPLTKYIHRLRGVVIADMATLFIGTNVNLDNKYPRMISLGRHVTIAGGARLTAHADFPQTIHEKYLPARVAPIRIGDNVFIGAGAIILAGVTVSDWVVIGAGAVVTKDVESYQIVAGNPARVIGDLRDYANDHGISPTSEEPIGQ